jgi:tetratricopeptide (TPR) repeat protein
MISHPTGLVKSAIVNLNYVIKQKPRHPDPYLRRAQLFELEEEHLHAIDDFKRVTIIDPQSDYALYRTATYQFEKQHYTDALKTFGKLLNADPLNGLYFAYRGRIYAYLNKWAKATKVCLF